MKYAATLLVLAAAAIATPVSHSVITLTPCPTSTVYETVTAPPAEHTPHPSPPVESHPPQPPAESHPPSPPAESHPPSPPAESHPPQPPVESHPPSNPTPSACPAPAPPKDDVFDYDCTFDVHATPDQVRNGTTPAPGQPGATGRFRYGVNIAKQLICYSIQLSGVTGEYMSPARTATHIHEAARGASGPPRIAFPNPVGPDDNRVSVGCLQGPFKTGLPVNNMTGTDTGDGFRVEKLCQNPAGFFTDVHNRAFSLGAVRGQLA